MGKGRGVDPEVAQVEGNDLLRMTGEHQALRLLLQERESLLHTGLVLGRVGQLEMPAAEHQRAHGHHRDTRGHEHGALHRQVGPSGEHREHRVGEPEEQDTVLQHRCTPHRVGPAHHQRQSPPGQAHPYERAMTFSTMPGPTDDRDQGHERREQHTELEHPGQVVGQPVRSRWVQPLAHAGIAQLAEEDRKVRRVQQESAKPREQQWFALGWSGQRQRGKPHDAGQQQGEVVGVGTGRRCDGHAPPGALTAAQRPGQLVGEQRGGEQPCGVGPGQLAIKDRVLHRTEERQPQQGHRGVGPGGRKAVEQQQGGHAQEHEGQLHGELGGPEQAGPQPLEHLDPGRVGVDGHALGDQLTERGETQPQQRADLVVHEGEVPEPPAAQQQGQGEQGEEQEVFVAGTRQPVCGPAAQPFPPGLTHAGPYRASRRDP